MTKKSKNWDTIKLKATSRFCSSKELNSSNGAIQPLIKEIIKAALKAELQEYLSQVPNNCKNSKSTKIVKSNNNSIELKGSRDQLNNFEPKILKKYQRTLDNALDKNILTLWSKEMSYSGIRSCIR